MKQINNYIQEKLYIGKDYDINLLSENEYIFSITIVEPKKKNNLEVKFFTPIICKEITNGGKKLHYKYVDDHEYKEEGELLSTNVFKNDKGFYEGVTNDGLTLFMNINAGINFLDKWGSYDIEKLRELLPKYFDKNDRFLEEIDNIEFDKNEHPDFKYLYNAYKKLLR